MQKPAPYDFLFDYLPRNVIAKTQFGMCYIYLNKKLVQMLRKTGNDDGLNGIFIATLKVHHLTLKQDIPALTNFTLETGEQYESHWLFLAEGYAKFETSVTKICELISRDDLRIGKETKRPH